MYDIVLLLLWLLPAPQAERQQAYVDDDRFHVSPYHHLNITKLLRTSVRLCVCVPDFGKRADRFPLNFSWFIGVIHRLERKKFLKCRPLMCKNSENGAKLPISRKSCGLETARGPLLWRHGQRAQRARAVSPAQANFMNQTFMKLS